MEHESYGNNNSNRGAQDSHQRIGTGTEGIGNKRMSSHHPNDNIVEIGQKTKKCLGDLRRLAITQAPLKDNQLSLARKALNGGK